ncbi:MAG: class I SAM-dependent methyltransferase [Bacteroidota bacterium]
MASIQDDRGYNQGFKLVPSSIVRLQRRAAMFTRYMNATMDGTILEIGCGTGELSYWVAQQVKMHVCGTDLCVPFIEKAQTQFQLTNLEYKVIDFSKPEQLMQQSFDYVIGNGVLHHLYYSIDEAILNLAHLLKKKGSLLFFEPNIYNPYCALIFHVPILRAKARLEPDEMAFSKKFIVKKLQSASFRNIVVEYRDFLLPGIPEFLIKPSILLGDIVEQIPPLNRISQSLFIKAEKE